MACSAQSFKLSSDPDFESELVDMVGLYLGPPEQAVVSFDEKTQPRVVPNRRCRSKWVTGYFLIYDVSSS